MRLARQKKIDQASIRAAHGTQMMLRLIHDTLRSQPAIRDSLEQLDRVRANELTARLRAYRDLRLKRADSPGWRTEMLHHQPNGELTQAPTHRHLVRRDFANCTANQLWSVSPCGVALLWQFSTVQIAGLPTFDCPCAVAP
jgi:hypothetical protein